MGRSAHRAARGQFRGSRRGVDARRRTRREGSRPEPGGGVRNRAVTARNRTVTVGNRTVTVGSHITGWSRDRTRNRFAGSVCAGGSGCCRDEWACT